VCVFVYFMRLFIKARFMVSAGVLLEGHISQSITLLR